MKDFDVTSIIPAKDARRMDTFIHYGLAAGIEALEDAGFSKQPNNAERIGVNIGSGIGGLPLIEETDKVLEKSGPRKISPFFIPGAIINMVSGNLSIMYGLRGPSLAMVTACTTATHCIGDSARLIEYGDVDVMVASVVGVVDGVGYVDVGVVVVGVVVCVVVVAVVEVVVALVVAVAVGVVLCLLL